jgi:exopolysaccharide production protein ExoY
MELGNQSTNCSVDAGGPPTGDGASSRRLWQWTEPLLLLQSMRSVERSLLPDSATAARFLPRPPLGGAVKRAIDVALAASALAFFVPLFGLVACLVKLYDGGPVFYRHSRVGHGGRQFQCLKFRTMDINADEILERHLATSPTAAQEWLETRKLRSDPRITAVGMVLRKTSIDELPQLINVLRGDMSIVGPRPIVSEEIAKYGAYVELYWSTRPGLTGLWQISGRNDKTYEDRVALDCNYVQNWSLGKDLVILVRTIPAVLSSRGCY